jgi:hypothetical protein
MDVIVNYNGYKAIVKQQWKEYKSKHLYACELWVYKNLASFRRHLREVMDHNWSVWPAK